MLQTEDQLDELILIELAQHDTAKDLAMLLLDKTWWDSVQDPWHVIAQWNKLGETIIKKSPPEGYYRKNGYRATIWAHKTAEILPGAFIEGPAIICPYSLVGPNCTLREFVLLRTNVTVGQGAEVKSSLVLAESFLSHFCYLGHSILGAGCSFSAGVITATRRLDGRPSPVWWKGKRMQTDCEKMGAVIGNEVMIGVNSAIMPGSTIAPRSYVLPGLMINGEYTSV